MSGALDARARETTLRLVGKYGAPAQLLTRGGSGYDPEDGTVGVSFSRSSVTVMVESSGPVKVGEGETTVTQNVVLLSAKGLTATPASGDQLVLAASGDTPLFRINEDPEAIYSGAMVALYRLKLVGS